MHKLIKYIDDTLSSLNSDSNPSLVKLHNFIVRDHLYDNSLYIYNLEEFFVVASDQIDKTSFADVFNNFNVDLSSDNNYFMYREGMWYGYKSIWGIPNELLSTELIATFIAFNTNWFFECDMDAALINAVQQAMTAFQGEVEK